MLFPKLLYTIFKEIGTRSTFCCISLTDLKNIIKVSENIIKVLSQYFLNLKRFGTNFFCNIKIGNGGGLAVTQLKEKLQKNLLNSLVSKLYKNRMIL